MQSKLIVPEASQPNQEGVVLRVTPESAGWSYVGYEMVKLKKGEALTRETGRLEACLVFLSGKGDVRTAEKRWTGIGQRMSVFEKTPPYSVYVPSEDRYEVVAETDVDLAVCTAPGAANMKPGSSSRGMWG